MADMNRTPICPYADTAENLELRNDILLQGQIVYNLTNNTYKVGDGKSHWTEITTEYKYGENGTIVEDNESNDFIVNFTVVDENMNCTTDKTFAEIQTAKQEGCNIYGTVEIIQDEISVSVKVPLTCFNEYGFWFTGICENMSLVLTIIHDGACSGNITTFAHLDSLSDKADWGNTLEAYRIMDAYTKTEVDNKLSDKSDKSTTLAGYGITDAYTKAEVDNKLSDKDNESTTLAGYGITDAYTKTEVDNKLSDKSDKSTTLSGYGITDAYTKTEVDNKLSDKVTITQLETAIQTAILDSWEVSV